MGKENLIHKAASIFIQHGLSVIPVRRDKHPYMTLLPREDGKPTWMPFQKDIAERTQIDQWFMTNADAMVGIACGSVSGGLEVVDFDNADLFPVWYDTLHGALPELFDKLPIVESPRGYHAYYRCENVSGNTKLAWRWNPEGREGKGAEECTIETRGEGGYVLAPPSNGYRMYLGKLTSIPAVTAEERAMMLDIARGLTESIRPEYSVDGEPISTPDRLRPGDHFNMAGDITADLQTEGWQLVYERNDIQFWRRPGKDRGVSATFNFIPKCFYVFSSNAYPFDANKTYTRFSVHALLNHSGNYSMAAKDLAAKGFGDPIDKKREAEKLGINTGGENRDTTPYGEKNGRLVYIRHTEKRGIETHDIADFTARITSEITDEKGDKHFVIEGKALRGGKFSLEIEATKYSDPNSLRACIEAVVGALDPVYARMHSHLGPAIKRLTDKEKVTILHRYSHTGWVDKTFLIPGREKVNVEIKLPDKMCFSVKRGNLEKAADGLRYAIESLSPTRTTSVLSFLLGAPLARLSGWEGERYAMFVKGRTGSLKTSHIQLLMSIYGPDFIRDENIVKWGEGGTMNARMQQATACHDLPYYIDNYKPTTGKGTRDFINLIHNILEGSERDRLDRSSQLKKSRYIFCWPVCTGEDLPDTDPASLARILAVTYEWQRGKINEALTKAQSMSSHLSTIGDTWISFLESDEGISVADAYRDQMQSVREEWGRYLEKIDQDMINILRVATSLALNQLSYQAAMKCSELEPVLSPYESEHKKGLLGIAPEMASYTIESLEGVRFVEALKELIVAGKATLLTKGNAPSHDERDRVVGWIELDGSCVYLLVSRAREMVERMIGKDALGGISNSTLYGQLQAMGYLYETGQQVVTKAVRVYDDKIQRCLHMRGDRIQDKDRSTPTPDKGEDAPF